MKFQLEASARRFDGGMELLEDFLNPADPEKSIRVCWEEGEECAVSFDGTSARIQGSDPCHFFRGIGILLEKAPQGAFSSVEHPVFDQCGASFDLSRNGVMTPEALKRMFCRMALMGYNQVYLYTEDTYQLPQYPFFGYMRGRYTKEELQDLDETAAQLGLEMIPCIQTLGHLERFLHWESSAPLRDTPDVLQVDLEESYVLIENMIAQCRQCYRTDKIHVGMDEAMNLGLGAYLRAHGFQDSFSIMERHVARVLEICQKYGFHPMMWSDMYFRCASPTGDYYEDDIQIPASVVEKAPKDMELVYWDYYHDEEGFYDNYIREHQKFPCSLRFAAGMWTWMGPAIDYDVFFRKTFPALRSCVRNGIRNVMLTTWGDDGAENSPQTMLLGLQAFAEFCYRQTTDLAELDKRLLVCTGADGKALRRISDFNKTPHLSKESDLPNGAKFLLYQDPLAGLFDADIEGLGFANQYAILEEAFEGYASRQDEWEDLYRFYALLAQVLKHKSELGIRLYRAYQNGDTAGLLEQVVHAQRAADSCGHLLEQWRRLWLTECRPFGFEVLEIRLSGVRSRLETAADRVSRYCRGELDRLEELEQERLLLLRTPESNQLHGVYFWKDIASAAKLW